MAWVIGSSNKPGVKKNMFRFNGGWISYRLASPRWLIDVFIAPTLLTMIVNELRGGVAPKSGALVRTVFFIPEAPCLGDWPLTSFQWSRVRSSRLAEALYLLSVKLLISERRE